MNKFTHSPALQGTVQFAFYSLLALCFFLVPSLLIAAVLSGLGHGA